MRYYIQRYITSVRGGITQERLQHSLPEAASYGGTAILTAWFLLFFSGEIWGIDFERAAELVGVMSLVTIASCLVGLLILNALERKGIFAVQLGKPYFLVLGVLLCAGTVGIVYGHLASWVLFIVSCVAVGICGAFFGSAAIMQLSRKSPREVLLVCGVVFLVGIFIYSFAFYVPRQITIPIICLLPLFGCPFFAFDNNQPALIEEPVAQENGKKSWPAGWRIVVLLSVFMLFSCVVRGYLPLDLDNELFSYIRSFSIILLLVAGAVAVAVPLFLPRDFRLSNLFKGVFIGGVFFFALFPIFGMDNPVVLIISDAYRGLCALVTLTLFAGMARRMPFFGFRFVGGALALFVAFGFLGWLLGTSLYYADFSEDVLRIYNSIQCALVLLAFIVLFRQPELEEVVDVGEETKGESQGAENAVGTSDEEDGSSKESAGGRWRKHCAAIAHEKGLTAREEEIFFLLAKGFKAQNISERLSVSYHTTRAHIRNIYQKCGVHSQQEFVDLVEAAPESDKNPQ